MNDQPQRTESRIRLRLLIPIILFGIILPVTALVIEINTGMSAEIYFNPIPGLWHIVLIAGVALINAGVAVALQTRSGRISGLWRLLNGVAVGVAVYFAVIYLPLLPFALLGILFFGVGLLPLAPLCSLLCALILGTRIRQVNRADYGLQQVPAWPFMLLGLLAIMLAESPGWFTVKGLSMAASQEPREQVRGVKLIRALGDKDLLLRRCYQRSPTILSEIGREMDLPSISVQDARRVYYRVTGTPYNAMEPPSLSGWGGGARVRAAEWDFDQGGDAVASRVRGLALSQSRMDSVVDAGSATVYTEWILEFKNDSLRQREARMEIALPPGAVASRLTLWIDGEEREAAYNARGKVKAAYKRVVQRRRDPVLATTSGPDRILLQCFPVPPNGGTMKTKIGISAPLMLDAPGEALMTLPYIVEHNYTIHKNTPSSLWIDSDGPMTPGRQVADSLNASIGGSRHTLRGVLPADALREPFSIRVTRDPGRLSAWGELNGVRVLGKIKKTAPGIPENLVVVVDGSRRMEPYRAQVIKALEKLGDVSVLLASDRVRELEPDQLTGARFAGGCDNVPALVRAWDLAAEEHADAILWLHATQPFVLQHTESLRQRWERRHGGPVLYDFQFGPGPNLVAKGLDGIVSVRQVPQYGQPEEDLARLLDTWNGTREPMAFVCEPTDADLPAKDKGSSHLVRLWVAGEVERLLESGAEKYRQKAINLAMTHRLVTPVTGAVVLENEQQYKEAGLDPVSKDTVPQVVPEPETWLYLFAGVLAVWYGRKRSKG